MLITGPSSCQCSINTGSNHEQKEEKGDEKESRKEGRKRMRRKERMDGLQFYLAMKM